jgi:hypothetical protein
MGNRIMAIEHGGRRCWCSAGLPGTGRDGEAGPVGIGAGGPYYTMSICLKTSLSVSPQRAFYHIARIVVS